MPVNTYSLSDEGLKLIETFEGLKLTAYQDQVGVWTIGYGSTRGVRPGMVISQAQAEALLRRDVHEAECYVNAYVLRPISQSQFDALVSFTFNLGCGSLRGSTLLKYVNSGKLLEAAMEFPKWDRAGGKESSGLLRRREAEKTLFLS